MEPTVYIVDDDPSVLDSIVVLLGLQGFRTRAFPGASHFLESLSTEWAGCALVDLRMPGMSGLELQREMVARGIRLPVVIISAHGDLPAARAAFKSGAVDFLEKPLDNTQLKQALSSAFERDARQRAREAHSARITALLNRLTARERTVLDAVVAGRHNREIAAALGISARTVEVYKSRLMAKLEVERVPDLVRLLSDKDGASK